MSFTAPVADRITQQWGENPDFYAQFGQRGHTGIDYASAVGTPIKASESGTVAFAGPGANHGGFLSVAGNAVLIEHTSVYTGYAHLSRINVVKGQAVKQGDIIGLTGATGVVSGPHLHFEFWGKPTNWQNGWSGRVNPSDYLTKGSKQMVEDNQVHFDTLSQTFYWMAGRKLSRAEFGISCVGRPWDEALRNLFASSEVNKWEQYALAGKGGSGAVTRDSALKYVSENLR